MTTMLIGLCIVAVIAAALFGDQIAALFAGMTPLEALQMIVTFMLRAAVAAIVATMALGLPKWVKPWMRMARRSRRFTRRQPTQAAAPRANYSALSRWLLNQQNPPKTRQQPPMNLPSHDETRLNF